MNREEAKSLLPIITAFSEGKTILVKDKRLSDDEDSWSETNDYSFNIEKFDYRIKPNVVDTSTEDALCEKCAFSVKNEYCGLLGFTSKYPTFGFCSAYNDKAPKGFELQENGYFGWIKNKEPKYRPFKDAEECWDEMLKHQPFGWVKNKECNAKILIRAIEPLIVFTSAAYPLEDAFKCLTFADGAVFGVREE